MDTVHVELGTRSYPIYIGSGLLNTANWVGQHVKSHQVLIVTNETIAPLYLAAAEKLFAAFETAQVILPDGENYKNLTTLNQIFDTLLSHYFDRQCTLVALGGGVVGDMTGFAAACYQRGVAFIQIPTTLLAQVDSSVGGKTGVNHPLGKNMIGAFHQPQAVLIDTDTLNTLDDRQLSAGLAEVVKYGLIRDKTFLQWLMDNRVGLFARDPDLLKFAIARSCELKADIVAADERESGLRALLNLGHTFGHALETGLGYGHLLHGEAVAIGLVLAANLSRDLGWIDSAQPQQLINLLKDFRLPTTIPSEISVEKILALMKVDKKAQKGKIRLILLKEIGEAILTTDYTSQQLSSVLADGYARAS